MSARWAEELTALLRVQRRLAARRGGLVRDSREWREATDELDRLNARIMVAAVDSGGWIQVGGPWHLALDARPANDEGFRGAVIEAIVLAVRTVEDEGGLDGKPPPVASEQIRIGALVIREAQASLRRTYPAATVRRRELDAAAGSAGDLDLLAEREGAAA
jgi:hypothetical protein